MKRLVPFLFLAVALLVAPAFAASPQKMTYQGVLTDALGAIVPDGNYKITFRIYDDPVLGGVHLLWTEAHDGAPFPLVAVDRGGFSVVLGEGVPLTVPFNGPMWLELQVSPDPLPMSPRTPLTPAPYALNVRNVYDGGASNFVGIGRANQLTPAEYFGVFAPVAAGFGGMYIQTNGPTSKPFYGYYTGAEVAYSYLDGSDANKWKLFVSAGDRLTVTTSGAVGVGTTNPTTRLQVEGGTKLGGAGAPAILTKKLTGTTNALQNGQSSILHDLDSSKILAVDVLVEYGVPGFYVPPSYLVNPGFEFSFYVTNTSIIIWNRNANSVNILSKPVKILVTYEE
jgi:hypothetical protein